MPLPILAIAMIAGATAGTGMTILGKSKENLDAQKRIDIQKRRLEIQNRSQDLNRKRVSDAQRNIADQKDYLKRSKYVSDLKNVNDMTTYAVEQSRENKNAAVQAFQQKSMAEAASGTTGTVGGTPFYSMALQNAEARRSLLDFNEEQSRGRENVILGNQMNNMAYRQNQQQLDYQHKNTLRDLEQIGIGDDEISIGYDEFSMAKENLEYANSPLSWGLSLTSAAIQGASTGASLYTAGINAGIGQGGASAGGKAAMQSPSIAPKTQMTSMASSAFNTQTPVISTGVMQGSAFKMPSYQKDQQLNPLQLLIDKNRTTTLNMSGFN